LQFGGMRHAAHFASVGANDLSMINLRFVYWAVQILGREAGWLTKLH